MPKTEDRYGEIWECTAESPMPADWKGRGAHENAKEIGEREDWDGCVDLRMKCPHCGKEFWVGIGR